MAWLYEKSQTWRKIVRGTKESSLKFLGFTAACVIIPYGLGSIVMAATSSKDKEAELLKRSSADGRLMSAVNTARLNEFLGEIKRGDDTEDRYVAALRGETATGPVGARRTKPGTSMIPLPELEASRKASAVPDASTAG